MTYFYRTFAGIQLRLVYRKSVEVCSNDFRDNDETDFSGIICSITCCNILHILHIVLYVVYVEKKK